MTKGTATALSCHQKAWSSPFFPCPSSRMSFSGPFVHHPPRKPANICPRGWLQRRRKDHLSVCGGLLFSARLITTFRHLAHRPPGPPVPSLAGQRRFSLPQKKGVHFFSIGFYEVFICKERVYDHKCSGELFVLCVPFVFGGNLLSALRNLLREFSSPECLGLPCICNLCSSGSLQKLCAVTLTFFTSSLLYLLWLGTLSAPLTPVGSTYNSPIPLTTLRAETGRIRAMVVPQKANLGQGGTKSS